MHSFLSPVYFAKNIWTHGRLWLQNPSHICCKYFNTTPKAAENRKRPLHFENFAQNKVHYFISPLERARTIRTITVTFPNYVLSLQSIAHLDVWRKVRPFYWFFKCFFAGVHSSRLMLAPSHSFAPLPLFITFTRNLSSLISSTQNRE